jgi:hypothetical protein
MKKIFILITILEFACSSIKQNSQEWQVIYPDPTDSTIVQVKGLYTSKGKLLYNNKNESNINKESLDNDYLFKPTAEQIIALEEFVIRYELANNPLYKNDTLKALKKYKKYSRLYTGYVCANGDSVFLLNMIERAGNIAKYKTVIPPIMAEPGVKVLKRKVWLIDLKRNRLSDIWDYYSTCISVKIQE